jgi:hypothetical protein
MVGSSGFSSLVSSVVDFDSFIGECVVKNLKELFEMVSTGSLIVPVSYKGIAEGIDMWYFGSGSDLHPRYYIYCQVVSLVLVIFACIYTIFCHFHCYANFKVVRVEVSNPWCYV